MTGTGGVYNSGNLARPAAAHSLQRKTPGPDIFRHLAPMNLLKHSISLAGKLPLPTSLPLPTHRAAAGPGRRVAALLALGAFLAGCGSARTALLPGPAPSAPVASVAAPAATPAASAAAVNPQVLMLGEVHDNVEGQRVRFEELKRRVEAGWRPAIAMEQFDHENQGLLSTAMKDCADPDCIIRVMAQPNWNWALYRPVLDLAINYRLPLIAANLSRSDASRVVRDGLKATFDSSTLALFLTDSPAADEIRRAQQKEVVAGHCNMLPDMMVNGVVEAQIARDLLMAKIIREQLPRNVVLLAGNGHVRNDIGAARWLRMVSPELNLRTEAYLEKGNVTAVGAYDFTHIVAPQRRADPCATFHKKAS
jgi:uncharacterized iron-regulated protein